MEDNEFSPREEPAAPQPPPAADKADDKVTVTRAELNALQHELKESRESATYWSSLARNGHGSAPQPEPQVDDGPDPSEFLDASDATPAIEGDTPEQLVNEFAASGVSALAKRGFITASDAKRIAVDVALQVSRELIGRERQKMTTDQTIMSEFPELRDQNSELFKATSVRYQRAIAMDPGAIKTPAALYLAAEAARESLKRTAPPPRRDDLDDPGPEREEDRRARAAAQYTRPNGKATIEDDMDMLGPEVKEVARLMGISIEEFQKSRKELGTPRQRRR